MLQRQRLVNGLAILALVALLVVAGLTLNTRADIFDSPIITDRACLPVVQGGLFDSPIVPAHAYLPFVVNDSTAGAASR
jgi:hypothetical protein